MAPSATQCRLHLSPAVVMFVLLVTSQTASTRPMVDNHVHWWLSSAVQRLHTEAKLKQTDRVKYLQR